jgi:hypothetical protein
MEGHKAINYLQSSTWIPSTLDYGDTTGRDVEIGACTLERS